MLFGQRKELILVPFEKNGKRGYKNSDLEIIVAPIYEEAYPTYSSRGRFKLKGKYGFIDRLGNVAIKPKYDKAEDFYAGISFVEKKGKQKMIGTDGKERKHGASLCGAIFRYCLRMNGSQEITYFRNGKYGLYLKNGILNKFDTIAPVYDTVISLSKYDFLLKKEGKIAYLNTAQYLRNPQVPLFEYQDFQLFQFYNYKNRIDQYFALKKNDRWGYYQLWGHWELRQSIPNHYLTVTTMTTGFAFVEYEKNKWGWVSSNGVEYFR